MRPAKLCFPKPETRNLKPETKNQKLGTVLMQPRSYWKDGLTWACNSGMFVFGIVLAVLGVLLPLLFEMIQLEPSEAGALFLFLNFGALLITFSAGPAFDRFGYKWILVGCAFLTAGAFGGMGSAESYTAFAACSFLIGVGGGGLNAGINALVADLYPAEKAAALNRVGIFFGAGTFFIPLFVGTLLTFFPVGSILFWTGLICAIPGLLFLIFPFPDFRRDTGIQPGRILKLFGKPLLLLAAALLFFQSGNEITTGGWLTTFLTGRIGVSPQESSYFLSAFWFALIVGRIAAARVLALISPASLVQVGALISSAALALLHVADNPTAAFALSFLAGLGMAAIFPSVLGQATSRFPDHSGSVVGMLLGTALVGGMLIPWLTGWIVQQHGILFSLTFPVIGFLVVCLLQTILRIKSE